MIAIDQCMNSAKISVVYAEITFVSDANIGMSAVPQATVMFQHPVVVQNIVVISVENQLEQSSFIAVIADAFAMCIVVEFAIGV